jgi:hypothetical protein
LDETRQQPKKLSGPLTDRGKGFQSPAQGAQPSLILAKTSHSQKIEKNIGPRPIFVIELDLQFH